MNFRVHTALHEETNNGWIWASYPQLQARSVVQITNLATKRSVHCEYREIDKFFLKRFNQSKPDAANQMTMEENPMAISLWYRNALGIQGIGMDVDLELNAERFKLLGIVRSGSQHPDMISRLATRLGVLGVWLGITSIVVSLLSFHPAGLWFPGIGIGVILLTGMFGIWLSKGVEN
jgi:hypothetical protein